MKTAYELVDHVKRIAEIIREERTRLEASSTPADATAFAGHLARALRAEGARLPDGNPNRLRWAINESPRPMNDPTGHRATGEIVRVILDMLAKGAGDDEILADVAEVWPNHATKAEAEAELEAIRRTRAAKAAEATASAHEQRLRSAKKSAPRPIAPVMQARRHPAAAIASVDVAEGEFTYGDDVGLAGVG